LRALGPAIRRADRAVSPRLAIDLLAAAATALFLRRLAHLGLPQTFGSVIVAGLAFAVIRSEVTRFARRRRSGKWRVLGAGSALTLADEPTLRGEAGTLAWRIARKLGLPEQGQAAVHSGLAQLATTVAVSAVAVGSIAGAEAIARDGQAELDMRFERSEGNMVIDSSAHAWRGRLRGEAALVDGRFGRAVALSGNQGGVDFGAILDVTEAITIEAWVKPVRQAQTWNTVVSNWASGQGYWLGGSHSPGGFSWWVDGVSAEVNSGFIVGRWHHLAGTFDSKNGELVLYVNGRAAARARHEGRMLTSDDPLVLGNRGGLHSPWTGLIDEVRIWNSVRSPEDICSDAGGEVDANGRCSR
jgi:Concanavalin A-like lectin/glucanases superfamily